ncbi:MAG: PHP domain-containing protein [Polyangia bacterium]
MDRHDIAAALREVADWLDFEDDGKKSFRARAYRKGADAIEQAAALESLIAEDRVTELPGIGAGLASLVAELHRTGHAQQLDKLRADHPAGFLDIRNATGLSPLKIRALHDALSISTLDELSSAIASEQVRGVKGFSEASEQKLAEAIASAAAHSEEILRRDAEVIATRVIESLAPSRVEVAGQLRRGLETIDLLELVTDDPAALDRFVDGSETEEHDSTSAMLRVREGLHVRLTVAPEGGFGSTLFATTGPDDHVDAVLARAHHPLVTDERELYAAARLPFIPPELRDAESVIETADAGDAFDDLLVEADIRGLVHCHTVYSDGKNTIEEMARAAEARGYDYLTITDHSPTAHYARGVEIDRLKRQWDEIAEVQEKVKIRLLRGTESDITKDGSLDYPDAILEQMDVVVASIHNRYKLDRAEMTERIVRAMQVPVFKIWGHALGRILLERDPIDCDVERIFDVIAKSRAAVEVNGDPHRIDLPPHLVPLARARGIQFVVSVDAHSTDALGHIRDGVLAARRGGLRKGDVLNTRSAQAFLAAVRPAG